MSDFAGVAAAVLTSQLIGSFSLPSMTLSEAPLGSVKVSRPGSPARFSQSISDASAGGGGSS
jgi:hypothetical protein